MKIHLIAVGRRMPDWIQSGFAEYARRLPPECALRLIEIEPAVRGRGGGDPARFREEEGRRILKAIPKGAAAVALDARGTAWSTEELSRELAGWLGDGRDRALLVGGPDGLDADCLAAADRRWSLSPLTFPHPLVRVILAEQLYRAWSLLKGHPYHRGEG